MLQAKKSFGQNFLVSAHHLGLLDREVSQLLDISKPKKILEVGPGMGALTKIILKNTDLPLECWEIDPEAVEYLRKTEFIDQLKLVQRDALEYLKANNQSQAKTQIKGDFDGFVLISNLPYNVGSRILIEITLPENLPLGMLVMLQKEVGHKLLAKEKNINLLGAFLRLYYDFKIVANIPRSAFSPQPKIESVLVQALVKKDLNLTQTKNIVFQNRTKVLETLKKLLIYPSKTLANNLKNLDWDKVTIDEFLTQNKLDKNVRLEWKNYIALLELVLNI